MSRSSSAHGPAEARGKRVFVDFEGVMTAATVWINGVRLSEYKGRYTPFSFDLTAHVDFGGENVIAVDVDSTERPDIPLWIASKIRNWKRARAFRRFANVDLRHQACFSLIGLGDFFLKFAGVAGVHEIDGSAAKPAARHARAENAFLLVSQVHHQIQFAATDLVQIAEATMGFGHAHSEAADVAGTERVGAVEHARVFRDNVQRALVDSFRKHIAMLLKLLEADVPKSVNSRQNSSETADSLFAIRASAVVFAGG
jgi:hypothetical protein